MMTHVIKIWWGIVVLLLVVGGGLVWWQRSRFMTNTQIAPLTVSPRPSAVQTPVPVADTDTRAVAAVEARPEVQQWLRLFSGPERTSLKTGGRASIEVDHTEGDVATVHVYEILRDHTATQGWYEVHTKTGVVTPMTP